MRAAHAGPALRCQRFANEQILRGSRGVFQKARLTYCQLNPELSVD